MTCHTLMIFNKRLTDGWRNVSAATYSLSTHFTDSISYADADMYPNVHVVLKLLLILPVGSCTRGRSCSALRHLKTKTEDRLCGLAMLHVHRNDTYRQMNPDAVIKRWDSSGSRKIHLAFTD